MLPGQYKNNSQRPVGVKHPNIHKPEKAVGNITLGDLVSPENLAVFCLNTKPMVGKYSMPTGGLSSNKILKTLMAALRLILKKKEANLISSLLLNSL
jgi:hypothetical protein